MVKSLEIPSPKLEVQSLEFTDFFTLDLELVESECVNSLCKAVLFVAI